MNIHHQLYHGYLSQRPDSAVGVGFGRLGFSGCSFRLYLKMAGVEGMMCD